MDWTADAMALRNLPGKLAAEKLVRDTLTKRFDDVDNIMEAAYKAKERADYWSPRIKTNYEKEFMRWYEIWEPYL